MVGSHDKCFDPGQRAVCDYVYALLPDSGLGGQNHSSVIIIQLSAMLPDPLRERYHIYIHASSINTYIQSASKPANEKILLKMKGEREIT
jgi:hypothetical protein